MGAVPRPPIRWVGAHPNNFTVGRPGGSIGQRETFHHIVGSGYAAEQTFNNPTRQASAHFSVDYDGEIRQHVRIDDTAYSDGNWGSNLITISVEHAGGIPSIPYTDPMYEASAQLRAWLRENYGSLYAVRHRQVSTSPTECSGGLDVERIVGRAEEIIRQYNTPTPPPAPEWLRNRQSYSATVYAQLEGMALVNLNDPSQPADARRFPRNTSFEIGSKTTVSGAEFYITVSSTNNNTSNGIRVTEVATTPWTPPVPTPAPITPPEPASPKWDDALIDDPNRELYVLRATPLVDLEKGTPAYLDGKEIWFKAGDIIKDVSAHTIISGVTYHLTEYSFAKHIARGLLANDLTTDPKACPIGTPANPGLTPLPPTPIADDPTPYDKEQDKKIDGIMALLKSIGDAIANLLSNFKK